MEGRYPNTVVAGQVAAVVGEKARHIRDRGFDAHYYRDLIVALIKEHGPVTREDINRLLLDKLPAVLSQDQRLTKIHNLLTSLSGHKIKNSILRNPGGMPCAGHRQPVDGAPVLNAGGLGLS